VEVKNLNSYTALKRAVEHEIAEQPARWLADRREMGPGMKTTRGWDDVRGVTVPQRSKEDAHDYRYFPDPDLPPVAIDEAWRARVVQSLPELPVSRMRRYACELSLSGREAQALVEERAVCELFEGALDALCAWGVERVRSARVAANLVLQAAARLAHERGVDVPALGLTAPGLAALGLLRERGRVNNQAVEILLPLLPDLPAGDAPAALESLAGERGLLTVRDERALEQWVERAIAENPQAVKDVREGKQAAMGRLVGAVMRIAGGQADGRAVREALLRRLGGG
jgi:aspartyl-tRNA(Asn)/glutamyl-tRNA(Gln) amidotransferase subunit B